MNKYLYIIFLFVFILGCGTKEEKADNSYYYTCSMDPQVMESKPGNCPICKMPLTAVKKNKKAKAGELSLSDQQVELGHIITDSVREHTLGRELFLTGTFRENQNNTSEISSWVMGRIEKLYVKSVGESVRIGKPLYDLYSEDLNLTIKELRLAIDKKNKLNNTSPEIEKIITTTRTKLSLFGLTDKQIQSLEENENIPEIITIRSKVNGIVSSLEINEGSYVMEGGKIMRITSYASLWADAEIFSKDIPRIKEGMKVTVLASAMNDGKIEGKLSFVNPELNASSKINLVRVEVDNRKLNLKPGMQADFSILLDQFSNIALPTDAIILDEKGATVWIKIGHNKFKSVMVTTGMESNGYTEIKKGLSKGDVVVVSGAYLLNSEYIFRNGADPMAGHDMSKM